MYIHLITIIRNSISANLSDVLVEIAANKTTIPETTITIPEGEDQWAVDVRSLRSFYRARLQCVH